MAPARPGITRLIVGTRPPLVLVLAHPCHIGRNGISGITPTGPLVDKLRCVRNQLVVPPGAP